MMTSWIKMEGHVNWNENQSKQSKYKKSKNFYDRNDEYLLPIL